MTYHSLEAWWWPYVFILLAGWLVTDGWRFLGVYLGNRLSETSEMMVMVRALATAFVAAVIGNLVVFPGGALAGTPLALRIGAAAIGFAAFLAMRKSLLAGIATAEAVLCLGLWFWQTPS